MSLNAMRKGRDAVTQKGMVMQFSARDTVNHFGRNYAVLLLA